MRLKPGNPMGRAMMITLFLQLIALGLAIPVLIKLAGVPTGLALATAGGTALLCLVAGGMFRTPLGYPLGWLAQLAGLALGLISGVMFVVGVIFTGVYVFAFVLGKKIDNSTGSVVDNR
ncbi:DUF4233 domain-containing protein [Microlunatus sp. Gsoil 973]|uniref:DUF4233 domain-containing protein n=1 Tax=Microlunatus sp. Gsoil 973 TaxID=2672569 RepID=UPI0012B4D352|nr:DUF4233 domain-containing protein [Microlunatus sp. Gsoil 973]QGN31661.1 DUF4233 domain-containing protein [Microlunatus sp. Gsoil 973]